MPGHEQESAQARVMTAKLDRRKYRPFLSGCGMQPLELEDVGCSVSTGRKPRLYMPEGTVFSLVFGQFNFFFLLHWLEMAGEIQPSLDVTYDRHLPPAKMMTTLRDNWSLFGLFSSPDTTVEPNSNAFWVLDQAQAEPLSTYYREGQLRLPVGPFYRKVKLQGSSAQVQAFKRALSDSKLSFRSRCGYLYFANTLSASLGLPPNALHLGWPPLLLQPGSDLSDIDVNNNDYTWTGSQMSLEE